jgi:hypothetical protein
VWFLLSELPQSIEEMEERWRRRRERGQGWVLEESGNVGRNGCFCPGTVGLRLSLVKVLLVNFNLEIQNYFLKFFLLGGSFGRGTIVLRQPINVLESEQVKEKWAYRFLPFFENLDQDYDIWYMAMVCWIHLREVKGMSMLKEGGEGFIDSERWAGF